MLWAKLRKIRTISSAALLVRKGRAKPNSSKVSILEKPIEGLGPAVGVDKKHHAVVGEESNGEEHEEPCGQTHPLEDVGEAQISGADNEDEGVGGSGLAFGGQQGTRSSVSFDCAQTQCGSSSGSRFPPRSWPLGVTSFVPTRGGGFIEIETLDLRSRMKVGVIGKRGGGRVGGFSG